MNGGPDITGITVSDNGAGILTFQIAIPNRPVQTPGLGVYVSINADKISAQAWAPAGRSPASPFEELDVFGAPLTHHPLRA